MLTLPDVSHDEPDLAAKLKFPVLYWNHAALEMNRVSHSLGGPQTGPTMSSRAIGLLHLAMHDAFFGTLRYGGGAVNLTAHQPYLHQLRVAAIGSLDPAIAAAVAGLGNTLAHANAALSAAAMLILDRLYKGRGAGISALAHETLSSALSRQMAGYEPHIDTLGTAHRFGELVANLIFARLAVKPGEPGADQGRFEPRHARFAFRDEPSNPVRLAPIDPDHPERGDRPMKIYHAPYYGTTAASFAVTDDSLHQIAPPPRWHGETIPVPPAKNAQYNSAYNEVRIAGGAPGQSSTVRTPDQTVAAIYWAYDGANLIGTPPRLYNQVVRVVAWQQLGATPDATNPAHHEEFVRIFALANVAMADAGKFAWKEKFRYELWRPLSGIREHDTNSGPADPAAPMPGSPHLQADADPFWQAFGAPETNTNRITFKPPFPAYPSGHATFGAACFQMLRLYYAQKAGTLDCNNVSQAADNHGFSFVSDELNGISRDLYKDYRGEQPIEDQPGLVRTRIVRSFPSLKHAIWENAFSRIWLGVHWNYDAFAASDAQSNVGPAAKLPTYKDPGSVTYTNVYGSNRANPTDYPVGGVPLGLGIANDIFCAGLVDPVAPAPSSESEKTASAHTLSVAAALRGQQIEVKASNTSTTQTP